TSQGVVQEHTAFDRCSDAPAGRLVCYARAHLESEEVVVGTNQVVAVVANINNVLCPPIELLLQLQDAKADEVFALKAGVRRSVPAAVWVHDQLILAQPSANAVVHLEAIYVACVINLLSRRLVVRAILAADLKRNE